MGKLIDAIQAKLAELQQRESEPAPDYSDPHAALAYIKRRNEANYERVKLGRILIEALQQLPKARQDEFYERCVQPAARTRFTKAIFDDCMNPQSERGQKENSWILNNTKYGQDWTNAIAVLEEMVGPDTENRLSDEINYLVAPTNPAYPEEDKLVYPLNDEIDEIKNSLNMFHADSVRDMELLDEVKEDLAYVSEETRELNDKIDGSQGNVRGYQKMVNGATYDMQNRFIRHDLKNGKFRDKFPTMLSSDAQEAVYYTMDDLEFGEDQPFRQADLDEIREVRPNISQELKNDVLAVTDKISNLGEAEYRNHRTGGLYQGGTADDPLFFSEQGYKLYAYWPLYNAREKLVAAVRERDMQKIREAHQRYREVRQEMDSMLGIVQKHPTGLSEGNVNATRSLEPGQINPLPLNHMEDFVGHSQINGLFCLYALSKNTHSTPAQLLEDPIGVMSQAGAQYVENYGLGSRHTAGEKLYWAFSDTACEINFRSAWSYQTNQLCARAFDTVACLSSDPDEQARIAGSGSLAIAAGVVPVKEHIKEWKKLTTCSKEQRTLMYQHAVLLPEEEFRPLDYVAAFSQPNWAEQLDTNALIDRLKQQNRLDYGRLVDRVQEIAAQASTCNPNTDTKYSRDALIKASHKMFKEIIKKASPEERETEGFKKLEKYTNEMLLDTSSIKTEQRKLTESMDFQREEKKGIFLSSENSEEHKKMVRSQNTFRFKLLQMQGKALPESLSEEDKNYLKTISLKDAYAVAREATFDYCNKKTKNGKSRFFVHDTGTDRLKAAEHSIKHLDIIAEELDLRSPAQKLIDEARLDVFNNRRKNDWAPELTERAAAKLMYAMTLEHQGLSPEEQAQRLQPNRLEMGIAYIRGQDAFKKMMQNEGASNVADYVAEGHGKLTDAYVRGANSAAREQHREAGKDPKQMTYEEKSEVWKNQTLQF